MLYILYDMRYEILTDNGVVLGSFDSEERAKEVMAQYVDRLKQMLNPKDAGYTAFVEESMCIVPCHFDNEPLWSKLESWAKDYF